MTDGTIEFERGKRKWWRLKWSICPEFTQAIAELVPRRSRKWNEGLWITDGYIRSVESLAHKYFKTVIVNGKEK
jgi:hypothetical protein